MFIAIPIAVIRAVFPFAIFCQIISVVKVRVFIVGEIDVLALILVGVEREGIVVIIQLHVFVLSVMPVMMRNSCRHVLLRNSADHAEDIAELREVAVVMKLDVCDPSMRKTATFEEKMSPSNII